MQRSTAVALGVIMATLAPRGAWAEGVDWQVVDIAPGEPSDKVPNPPPSIRVRVVGESAPNAEARDTWRLELDPSDNPKRLRSVAPSSVVPYATSSDSLAVVVLVEGHPYYLGNDQYVLADGIVDGIIQKRSPGAYSPIVAALDQMGTINQNAASKGGLIVYSVGSDVRLSLGPLSELTGDKLGTQELQRGKTGRDLTEGLRASLAQLRGVTATRKALFVISDGFDAGGIDEIRALRKQFDAEQIDVFAFHYEAPTQYIAVKDGDQQRNKQVMQALGTHGNGFYWSVRDGDGLGKRLADAITMINARFYLVFPGQVTDPRTKVKSGFNWDGQEHDVRLLRDEEPLGDKPRTVLFQPVWGQVKPASNLWMWIVFPLGGVLLLGGLVMMLSRKKAPEPQPVHMPVTAAPPPPPAASIQPVAGGANKTMAINISSGDGVPVVGWIVPINGPQQYQTLKLFAGVTKVGNAHGAHIVIQDAFMSGEHAHVVMSPAGFTLIDNGSTNGTFVNERRVQRHELIDNDVVKFGKTDCKFKTINTDG